MTGGKPGRRSTIGHGPTFEPTGANMTTNKSLPIVLITGTSGFLGPGDRQWLDGRYRVIGLDVPNAEGKRRRGRRRFEIDLTSDESVAKAMAEVRERGAGASPRSSISPPITTRPARTTRNTTRSPSRARAGSSTAQDARDRAVRLLQHHAGARSEPGKGREDRRGFAARSALGLPEIEGGDRGSDRRRARRHKDR